MKKFLLAILFSTALFAQVEPITVLEIYGEAWNGAAFDGTYIGPAYTEYGTITTGTMTGCGLLEYLDFAPGDSLGYNTLIYNAPSNYVVFFIARLSSDPGATRSVSVIDTRFSTIRGHLSLGIQEIATEERVSYIHGNTTYVASNFSSTNENIDTYQLRCIILENDSAYYWNNGLSDTTELWIPSALGETNSNNKTGVTPTFDYNVRVPHLSIHRFNSGQTVSREWVNNYANALVTYYNDCTTNWDISWIDIQEGYSLDFPNAAGVYLYTDDTTQVKWFDDTGFATTKVYLKRDGTTPWEYLGSATGGDTSFTWVVTGPLTEQATILICNSDSSFVDESANMFSIWDNFLDILYPLDIANQTFEYGDTAHVHIASALVNSFTFFWSADSLLWNTIEEVIVDTANGFILDTTLYIWYFIHGEHGPKLWIKVSQAGDTTIYNFLRSFTIIGNSAPVGLANCQTYQGGNVIEKQVKYDVSCGWANPPIRYYNRWIRADASGFSQDYYVDPDPIIYPRLDPVYLIDGVDTNAIAINAFYDRGITLTYSGRTYYIHDKKLYSDDNVNNIDSILVCDLSSLYNNTYHWDELEDIYIIAYNVRWDSISNHYLPIDTTFENLNNESIFEPLLVLECNYTSLSPTNIVIEALPFPNPIDPAEDIAVAYSGLSTFRYFFRGIHPKAEKR